MGEEYIGLDFVKNAGFNQIAESNKLIIIYPMLKWEMIDGKSSGACWDFFGYSD